MSTQTYDKLYKIKQDLQEACDSIFKRKINIRIDESEDCPSVIMDDTISICYHYHEDYVERVYDIQVTVVEHNYPHEPDWIDYVSLDIQTNWYAAIESAIGAYAKNEAVNFLDNLSYEEQAKEYEQAQKDWIEEMGYCETKETYGKCPDCCDIRPCPLV